MKSLAAGLVFVLIPPEPGLSVLQVLYKVYISFVEVGAENVQTADYFKGVGESYVSS